MARPRKFSRSDLTDKQEKFLDAYIASGGSREAATHAVIAVYGYEKQAASAQASRLLKSDKIRDCLSEEVFTSQAAMAFVAQERLNEILTTGMWFGQPVKAADGLKAVAQALDRGGFAIAKSVEMNLTVEDNRSQKEMLAEVRGMFAQLSDTEKAALLQAIGRTEAEVMDADFEVIDPQAPWGRKDDGTPKQKPGAKPIEKRILPGPDAYRPVAKDHIAELKDRIRKRKLKRD